MSIASRLIKKINESKRSSVRRGFHKIREAQSNAESLISQFRKESYEDEFFFYAKKKWILTNYAPSRGSNFDGTPFDSAYMDLDELFPDLLDNYIVPVLSTLKKNNVNPSDPVVQEFRGKFMAIAEKTKEHGDKDSDYYYDIIENNNGYIEGDPEELIDELYDMIKEMKKKINSIRSKFSMYLK